MDKDSADLCKKIEYWIEHPEEKKRRSQEYLGFATEFDQDVCMDNMEKMLIDVIKANKEKVKTN